MFHVIQGRFRLVLDIVVGMCVMWLDVEIKNISLHKQLCLPLCPQSLQCCICTRCVSAYLGAVWDGHQVW